MLNIREDLKKLLIEADLKPVKLITKAQLAEEEAKRVAEEAKREMEVLSQQEKEALAAREKKGSTTTEKLGSLSPEEQAQKIKDAQNKENELIKASLLAEPESTGSFWESKNFITVCLVGLDTEKCLPIVYKCLSGDFSVFAEKTIDGKKQVIRANPEFDKGLDEVISFYIDVVDGFNAGQIIGKVKKALDTIKEDNILPKNKIAIIEKELANKKKLVLAENPYDTMKKELTDLCIAANVVNWERVLTFQDSAKFNFDLMILNDLFKPRGQQNSAVNQDFISTLSPVDIDKIYNDPSNKFAKFLKSFAWGRNTSDDESVTEAKLTGIAGDFGAKGGDNDRFVLNMLASYLSNLLDTNNQIDAGDIIKKANLLSINQAKESVTAGNISSFDTAEATLGEDPDLSGTLTDLDNPEFKSAETDVIGASAFDASGDPIGEDLFAAEELRQQLEELKTTNDWTLENNLIFLSNALKTAEGADGLSTILSKIFIALPGTSIRASYNCPAVVDKKVQEINLLDKFKDFATTSSFINYLSSIAFLLAPSKTRITKNENKSYIKGLIEAASGVSTTSTEITPAIVEGWIAKLPKTLEEAKSAFSAENAGVAGLSFTLLNASKEAKKINDIYNKVSSDISLFLTLSPNEFSSIPPEGLAGDSYLQKQLSISIVPEVAPGIAGITVYQANKGQTRVKITDLEVVWNSYYTAIKEILDPLNTASWGLLTPTLMSEKPNDPEASYGILYPTAEYPVGTKIGTKTVKPLFASKDQFTQIRNNILLAVATSKNRFLAATALAEVKQILTDIMAAFGSKKQLRFFSSPLTQTIDERKKCPLYKLVDPSRSIGAFLVNIEKTRTFPSGGGTTSNPFEDLVANILIANAKGTNETIIYSKRLSLFEAEESGNETSKKFELAVCHAAINTHIRARILLHLARIIEILQDSLIFLREAVLALEAVLTERLSEDNVGATEKLFSDIAKVVTNVISERESTSLQKIKEKIAASVSVINKDFKKSELARKTTSRLKASRSPDITFT